MTQVFIKINYSLEVSSKDFSLICKALRGQLKPSDTASAEKLVQDLTEQKVSLFDQQVREFEKLKQNIEKLKEQTGESLEQ